MKKGEHIPVLLSETLEILCPQPGEAVLDCTVGLGGHSAALAEAILKEGTLTILDADAKNLEKAKKRLRFFPGNLHMHHANFRFIDALNIQPCDIIFADLGLSSPHINSGSRGFSFRADGPLDMRFDQSSGVSAAECVASLGEEHLARVLRDFGEVRSAQRLAHCISEKQPQTTAELFSCCESVYGFRANQVAPQVFQAIRIEVNDEIESLRCLLWHAVKLLNPRGRLGIISYHSLEDRMVKQTFKKLATPEFDDVTGQILREAPFALLTKKPTTPSENEVKENPRSRSAKFRVLKRV